MHFALRLATAISASLVGSSLALAHISLDLSSTHKSRYGIGEIKQGPCGRLGGGRSENVYTYKPGETIQVGVTEFVPHPGYFRIAFDADGDAGFMNPRTILPQNRSCLTDPADHCGATDFFNNKTVLQDNLEPHLAGDAKDYTFSVKLPDVECSNCTLQLIQVMTDDVHAPYNPSYTSDGVYYQCIDLVLKK